MGTGRLLSLPVSASAGATGPGHIDAQASAGVVPVPVTSQCQWQEQYWLLLGSRSHLSLTRPEAASLPGRVRVADSVRVRVTKTVTDYFIERY